MTAKDYMKQADNTESMIRVELSLLSKSLKLMHLKVELMSDGFASSPKTPHTLDMLCKEMEGYLTTIQSLEDRRAKARSLINELDVPEYRNLMELRHLYSTSWKEIADRMSCSERVAHLLHGAALDELDRIIELDNEEKELDTEQP